MRSDALEKVGLRQWLVDTNSSRFDLSTVDPKLLEWHVAEHSKTPDQVAQSIRPIAESVDLSAALPRIKVPTLIMVGDRSPPSPLAGQIFMQKQNPQREAEGFPQYSKQHPLADPRPVPG